MWKKKSHESRAAQALAEELRRIEQERAAWRRTFDATLIGGSIASVALLALLQVAANWLEYETVVRRLAQGHLGDLRRLRWSFDAGISDAEATTVVTTSVVLVAALNVAMYAAALEGGRRSIGVFIHARWSSTLSILAALSAVVGVSVAWTRVATSLSLGLVLLTFAALGLVAAASMVSTPDRRALLVKKADMTRRLEALRATRERLSRRFGTTAPTSVPPSTVAVKWTLELLAPGAAVGVIVVATSLVGTDFGAYAPIAWLSATVSVYGPLAMALSLVGLVFGLIIAADVAAFGRDRRYLRRILLAIYLVAAAGWSVVVWLAFDGYPDIQSRVIAVEMTLLVWIVPAADWVIGYRWKVGFAASFGRQSAREAISVENALAIAIEDNDRAIGQMHHQS